MPYKDLEGPNTNYPGSNRHAKKPTEDSEMELMVDNLNDNQFYDPG